MRQSYALIWLCALIAVLALIAAATGLFTQDGRSVYAVTSLRGQTVQLYGQGLYRHDTVFIGAILGFMVSFAISTVVALGLTVVLFRAIEDSSGVTPV